MLRYFLKKRLSFSMAYIRAGRFSPTLSAALTVEMRMVQAIAAVPPRNQYICARWRRLLRGLVAGTGPARSGTLTSAMRYMPVIEVTRA